MSLILRSQVQVKSLLMVIIILFLTNCKDEETKPLALGQNYQGGIIFFLEDNGVHGLIAATTDQHTNIAWSQSLTIETKATATAPGSGKPNTETIMKVLNTGNHAASICDQLVHNGYDDWFLPSKDELNYLFIQKQAGRIGNFLEDDYWSSTENSTDRAWHQNMNSGGTHAEIKTNTGCIRAVRAF